MTKKSRTKSTQAGLQSLDVFRTAERPSGDQFLNTLLAKSRAYEWDALQQADDLAYFRRRMGALRVRRQDARRIPAGAKGCERG